MDKEGKIALISALVIISLLIVAMALAAKGGKGAKPCRDEIDNDGDGFTDYPDDPGCSSKNDNDERNYAVECDDGSDNDGDNATDMADNGCSSPSDNDETDCGDGVCEGGETTGNCPDDCGYPDSCSDTDGGFSVYTFGTTSGYYNNIPYSNDDYCVNADDLMEYYCSGDYEQTSQHNCGTDGYSANYCYDNVSIYRDHNDYFCASGECDLTITPEFVENCTIGCLNATCI